MNMANRMRLRRLAKFFDRCAAKCRQLEKDGTPKRPRKVKAE